MKVIRRYPTSWTCYAPSVSLNMENRRKARLGADIEALVDWQAG